MKLMQMSLFEFRYQSRNAAEHQIMPSTYKYSYEFDLAALLSFKQSFKKSFYAWSYESFSESLTWNDFFNCYLMGGEL